MAPRISDSLIAQALAVGISSVGRPSSHLPDREVEHAATLIGGVIELAPRYSSARLTFHNLDKWNDVKAVRDLKERYHALSAGPAGQQSM